MKKFFVSCLICTLIFTSFIVIPRKDIKAASTYHTFSHAPMKQTVIVNRLNIRSAPSTSSSIVGSYTYGSTFYSDRYIVEVTDSNKFRTWLSYVAYSGARRYVVLNDINNEQYLLPERDRF